MNPLFPFATAITLLVFLSPLPTLNAVVLDTDGEDVRNSGGSYYIIPKGSSIGLTLTRRPGSPSCPLYITQITTSPGTSVTISALVRTLFIPVSARVNIVFNTDVTTCTDPLEWRVRPDLATGKSYVTAGGGGPTGMSYRFTIEQAGNGEKDNVYKIRYCQSDETNCGDVGFLQKDGLLGINNVNPLFVQFKKVNTGMPETV